MHLFSTSAFWVLVGVVTALPSNLPPRSHLESRQTASVYASEALIGIQQLQKWYSTSTGLWNDEWWNSANVVTTLADYQEHFASEVSSITATVFPTTLALAPGYGGFTGFINDYYDDELWWCLAWIKVYDVTGQTKYLDMASSIFENAKAAYGTTPCGGLWWDKAHTYVNAIANELYITAAAKLANRKPSSPSSGYYFNEALKATKWFLNSGMINSDNTINDGLDMKTCKNNGATVWSYNQGVILSGLVELTWSTGSADYANLANKIALAAIAALTDSNGILHDACDASECGGDGGQFKGVFSRNLQFVVNRSTSLPASTSAAFKSFLQKNANALWTYDQNGGLLGPVWSGPYDTADVQTQSSALDTLIGAASVS